MDFIVVALGGGLALLLLVGQIFGQREPEYVLVRIPVEQPTQRGGCVPVLLVVVGVGLMLLLQLR